MRRNACCKRVHRRDAEVAEKFDGFPCDTQCTQCPLWLRFWVCRRSRR
jgi:hypothetical protein